MLKEKANQSCLIVRNEFTDLFFKQKKQAKNVRLNEMTDFKDCGTELQLKAFCN